jgi:hypothetical protein
VPFSKNTAFRLKKISREKIRDTSLFLIDQKEEGKEGIGGEKPFTGRCGI